MLISISNPITFVFYHAPQPTNPRDSLLSAEVVALRIEERFVEPVLEMELAVEPVLEEC